MNRKDALAEATQHLHDAGKQDAQTDARLLLQHVLNISRETLLCDDMLALTPLQQSEFFTLIDRRCMHEPVSQLVGYRDFYKDRFIVTSDVLTPRPDSETLIEAALQAAGDTPPASILDLGTGSGCLLLSLLREFPAAHGVGIDKSGAALEIAAHNAKHTGLAERCRFDKGHWVDALQTHFDMVISNPPYISAHEFPQLMPEVRDYEPAMALTAGEDGLNDYRTLLRTVPRVLNSGGCFILELGAGQAEAVCEIAVASNWNVQDKQSDLTGIIRALTLTR